MTDQASLNRFVMSHRAHGGRLQRVPQHGGQEWIECSRCGGRILAPPLDDQDAGHEDDDALERSA